MSMSISLFYILDDFFLKNIFFFVNENVFCIKIIEFFILFKYDSFLHFLN